MRLCRHEPVKLEDFGKFEVRLRKGWRGRHPETGERILVRSRYAVCFGPGKKIRRLVTGPAKDNGIVSISPLDSPDL